LDKFIGKAVYIAVVVKKECGPCHAHRCVISDSDFDYQKIKPAQQAATLNSENLSRNVILWSLWVYQQLRSQARNSAAALQCYLVQITKIYPYFNINNLS